MDKGMTKEESYVERRQLFKNIWEASMHIDDKDDNIMNKPKVIKTLHLNEVDKCSVGKTKKQRIKNLRHVCNKILDFCDRQDADDEYYAKTSPKDMTKPKEAMPSTPSKTAGAKLKNKLKKRKKIKVKRLFMARDVTVARATTSEAIEGTAFHNKNSSNLMSKSSHKTVQSLMKKSKVKKVTLFSPAHSENNKNSDDIPAEATIPRKILKKKRSKKKKKCKD